MAKMTITKTFDFPFRWIGQKNDGEPYYAVGTLRMEPLPAEAVEYAVDLPDAAFAPPVMPSFAEAIGAGIREYAAGNEIVGLRVTLSAIEANEIGSSDYWFHAAAQSALEDAIKVHGVFANPITIADPFDLPFYLAKHDTSIGDWARGMLRLEPVPTAAVEFVVSLPEEPLPPEVAPSFIAAVGKGVERSAKENGLAGLRVTLTAIQAHGVDSRNHSYEIAVMTAMRTALKTQGVPMPVKEGTFVPAKERAESNRVPTTPKRAGHTKESFKRIFIMLVGSLIFSGITAYQWHTRLQSGYYSPKLSFFAAAFAFGFAMLFIVGLLSPEQTATPPPARSSAEMQARIKATQWKLGAFFAVCLLAGLLSLILLDR